VRSEEVGDLGDMEEEVSGEDTGAAAADTGKLGTEESPA
jgi:hypothetical protein